MIPLSFASILGGTCTLIGTSTNLVVLGMLKDWRGADGTSETKQTMGLFDLGLYGVPVAMTGMTYMLLASRALLPGGKKNGEGGGGGGGGGGGKSGGKSEDLIVGARLQAWSAAVGKTVAGSGLRGLPGLYLVSVKREDTLIRAVGPEFVLTQGDVLYFTGMVESIGNVCAEYGLLAITTEHDSDSEGGSDDDEDEMNGGSDGDGGGDSRGRVSPEGGAEGGADTAVSTMDLGSTTESDLSDGPSQTKVKVSAKTERAVATNGRIPPSVPETSALMEIQMLARSQAIGGVAGEWQSGGGGGKSSKGKSKGGIGASSGGETSATSAGSASESEGGGAWSEGPLSGGETSEGNADTKDVDGEMNALGAPAPAPAQLVARPQPLARRRDPGHGVRRRARPRRAQVASHVPTRESEPQGSSKERGRANRSSARPPPPRLRIEEEKRTRRVARRRGEGARPAQGDRGAGPGGPDARPHGPRRVLHGPTRATPRYLARPEPAAGAAAALRGVRGRRTQRQHLATAGDQRRKPRKRRSRRSSTRCWRRERARTPRRRRACRCSAPACVSSRRWWAKPLARPTLAKTSAPRSSACSAAVADRRGNSGRSASSTTTSSCCSARRAARCWRRRRRICKLRSTRWPGYPRPGRSSR